MIPCRVVVQERAPAQAGLSEPTFPVPPIMNIRAVPTDSHSRQLVRFPGNTSEDSFLVYDSSTGHVVDLVDSKLVFTLYKVKNPSGAEHVAYRLEGKVFDPASGLVSFAPTTVQALLSGFYWYDIQMQVGKGNFVTLLSDSYVYRGSL